MPQKYELIYSASSTSSLFIYRRVFISLYSFKRIPCSSTAGRVEPQLNGFYEGIADKHPKGKPLLTGLEGGIEPDLNGFSASTIGIAPLVPFDLDLFSQTRWSSGSKMPGVLPGTVGAQGGFDPDSFRVCATVNLRFLTSFTNQLIT